MLGLNLVYLSTSFSFNCFSPSTTACLYTTEASEPASHLITAIIGQHGKDVLEHLPSLNQSKNLDSTEKFYSVFYAGYTVSTCQVAEGTKQSMGQQPGSCQTQCRTAVVNAVYVTQASLKSCASE